jgi:hypothetical protein
MDDEHGITNRVELNGLDFQLTAGRTKGGYHASWACQECGEADYCQLHDSSEEALEAAREGADRHRCYAAPRRPR